MVDFARLRSVFRSQSVIIFLLHFRRRFLLTKFAADTFIICSWFRFDYPGHAYRYNLDKNNLARYVTRYQDAHVRSMRSYIRRAWVILRYQLWVVLRSRISWFKMVAVGSTSSRSGERGPAKGARSRSGRTVAPPRRSFSRKQVCEAATVDHSRSPFRLTSVRGLRRGTKNRSLVLSWGERAPSNTRDVPNLLRTTEDHDLISSVTLKIKLRMYLRIMRNNYDCAANIN